MAYITIVGGKCIGAGNCVEIAEEYFDQNDDDATVIVLTDEVSIGSVARVRKAVNVCPVAAIMLTEPEDTE